MIRLEGLQLCFGSLNWWIESLQSLVTPGFPMAKFGKNPSLHACYILILIGDILQVKSIQRILQDPLEMVPLLIATFRSIHLQIHLARRALCCQASAASTDMRSVRNSGSWGWIKTNCHMFRGMKINQD